MTDARAEAVIPTAAALITAVARHNPTAVAQALAEPVDWPALAVVLAAQAGHITDPRLNPPAPPRMRPCVRCKAIGKRTGELCHHCAMPSPDDLETTDGRWVPGRNGIRRWETAS